jgi:hypothetical protein
MGLPYLEKIGERGPINIWRVDGFYIRENVDEEFTNFGQHYRFGFIPENEFWIDREADPDEQRFFIDHLLIEHRLMKKGDTYVKALETADRRERSERKKTGDIPKRTTGKFNPELMHLHLIAETNDAKIWQVNGRLVRSLFDIDFTEGGHDIVYEFVPKGEVWIDNDVEPEEIPYVLLHELHERSLMKEGMTYDEAHAASSQLEYHLRHHPEELPEALNKEMKPNEKRQP